MVDFKNYGNYLKEKSKINRNKKFQFFNLIRNKQINHKKIKKKFYKF